MEQLPMDKFQKREEEIRESLRLIEESNAQAIIDLRNASEALGVIKPGYVPPPTQNIPTHPTHKPKLRPSTPLISKKKSALGRYVRNAALAAGLATSGYYGGKELGLWEVTEKTAQKDNEKEKRLAAQKRMKERTKREEEAKQAQQPVDTSRPSPFSPLSEKTPPTPKETLHKVKPVPAETPDVKTITPEPSIETKMPAPTLFTEEIKPQEEKDGPPMLKRTPERKAEVLPTTKEEALRRRIEELMEEADARRTPARKGGEVPGRVTGYNPPQYDEYGRRVGGGPK